MRKHALSMLALVTILLPAGAAQAYIGPGAGLSAVGSALALIGALLLMIVGFVWYPIKRLMKRKKQSAPASSGGKVDRSTGEADEPVPDDRPAPSRSGGSS